MSAHPWMFLMIYWHRSAFTKCTVCLICRMWFTVCALFLFQLFQSSSIKRPIIPTEFGAKVPTNIRQRYLNTFIDECVKFCPSEEVAFQMVKITPSFPKTLQALVTPWPAWKEDLVCDELWFWQQRLYCCRPLTRRSWCMSAAAVRTSTST